MMLRVAQKRTVQNEETIKKMVSFSITHLYFNHSHELENRSFCKRTSFKTMS